MRFCYSVQLGATRCNSVHLRYSLPNPLQPKFVSQSQIDIPLYCLKFLILCRNNVLIMENHELGTDNDKMCAAS